MSDISARRALELWRNAELLSADQVEALKACLDRETGEAGDVEGGRGVTIFASIGAILVGLGILLFVASNWAKIGPLWRAIVLGSTYALIVAGAATAGARGQQRVARALWFLTTLSFGANIFFFGQIFNFTLTYWQGPLLWLVGTLAMAYAIESRLHALTAIPLVILTLGWLGGGGGRPFADQYEFLWSPAGLRPLFAIVGLAFVAVALIAERSRWSFASSVWFAWGSWLVALPIAIPIVAPSVFAVVFEITFAPKQIGILVGTGLLVGSAALVANRCKLGYRVFLAALFGILIIFLVPGSEDKPWLAAYLRDRGPILAYSMFVFTLALLTVLVGVGVARRQLVNVGMATASLVIVVQYLSWSFRLLDRSLAFIIGGLVLIALSVGIERKRRQLLVGMRS